MSATSSSSSVSSFYSNNGTLHMNGSEFASGLDIQNLIKAMTAKTQSKITRQQQLQQKAQWKQEMYRDVESLMQTFSDTYFSYASGSSTNIMSTSFFDSNILTSSNSAVSATGAAQNAGNVVINQISQLATAASVTSGYNVSEESITSGDIRNSWTTSAVGGKSLVVNYGGTDYTLTLSNSVTIDSTKSTADNLKTIAEGLNQQISGNSDLSGNIKFSVDTANNRLELTSNTASKVAKISAYKADDKDTSGADFLHALGFSSLPASTDATGKVAGATVAIDSTNITNNVLFNQAIKSGSYLTVKVDDKSYNLSLGGLDLSSAASNTSTADQIVTALNKQIEATDAIKGKVQFKNTNGTLSFEKTSPTSVSSLSVSSISSARLKDALGATGSEGAYTFSGSVDKSKLTTSYLDDALVGSTLTFNLNGVSKTITFNESEKSQYYDSAADATTQAGKIASYLQGKLDVAFGTGKVAVTNNGTDKLKFTTSDGTSVLGITSSSASNVLEKGGALQIDAGETNRVETSKTLKDLAGELNLTAPTALDENNIPLYKITVNGKTFSFNENTELNTVINTINDNTDANVNISYSQTTNKFRITSDDTGAQGKISVYDNVGGNGNLAEALFGVDYSSMYAAKSGNIVQASDGTISTGSNDSVYSFTLNGSPSSTATITIAKNVTYNSMQDLANSIQGSLNSTLAGKVSVGVTSDGKQLTFNSTTSTNTLTVSQSSGDDMLRMGQAAESTSSSSIPTSAQLSTWSNLGYNGVTTGSDLSMFVTLKGNNTQTAITRSSNSFTLDGVTMTVSGTYNTTANPSTDPIKFTQSNNVDDMVKKISDFVDAYNKIIDKANTYVSQTPYGLNSSSGTNDKYDPLTDDQKKDMTTDEITKWNEKAKQGLLENDNTLNTMLSDIRSAMESTVASVGMSLNDIGISTASYDYTSGGKLILSKSDLQKALQSNPEKVSELFTNDDGVAARVKETLVKNIGTYGNSGALVDIAGSSTLIGADNSQMGKQISDFQTTIKNLKTQLQTETDRWQSKFTQMNTIINKLSAQSSYLSSMSGS